MSASTMSSSIMVKPAAIGRSGDLVIDGTIARTAAPVPSARTNATNHPINHQITRSPDHQITRSPDSPVFVFRAVERRAFERRVDVVDVLAAPSRRIRLV